MKHFTFLLLILLLHTQCNKCDSGYQCCNPETSTLYVSDYVKEWIPYKTNDNYSLIHNGVANEFRIKSLALVDTSVFQGDECPDRPAQMIFGKALFGISDTISFSTYFPNVLLVEVDQIKFLFQNPSGQHAYIRYNMATKVQYFNELKLDSVLFKNVVLAESDFGKVSKIYMSKNIGVIAIEKDDSLFVKK